MMMVRKSKGLGERHHRILAFLQQYQRENKYPPSIREIGEKTGITSTSVVNYYLDQLEKKGLIERDRKISRGVRLAGMNGSPDTLRIPILGPIAAGSPIPELDPNISYLMDSEAHAVDIARSLLPSKEKGDDLYALEVQGESMIDAMINDEPDNDLIPKVVNGLLSGRTAGRWNRLPPRQLAAGPGATNGAR